MSDKKLLEESTIRRFQTLAKIKSADLLEEGKKSKGKEEKPAGGRKTASAMKPEDSEKRAAGKELEEGLEEENLEEVGGMGFGSGGSMGGGSRGRVRTRPGPSPEQLEKLKAKEAEAEKLASEQGETVEKIAAELGLAKKDQNTLAKMVAALLSKSGMSEEVTTEGLEFMGEAEGEEAGGEEMADMGGGEEAGEEGGDDVKPEVEALVSALNGLLAKVGKGELEVDVEAGGEGEEAGGEEEGGEEEAPVMEAKKKKEEKEKKEKEEMMKEAKKKKPADKEEEGVYESLDLQVEDDEALAEELTRRVAARLVAEMKKAKKPKGMTEDFTGGGTKKASPPKGHGAGKKPFGTKSKGH